MKNLAFTFITSAFFIIGCTTQSTDDHGHDHGPNGEHLEEEHGHDHDENHSHEQEGFVVEEEKTSTSKSTVEKEPVIEKKDDHGHDHGEHSHEH